MQSVMAVQLPRPYSSVRPASRAGTGRSGRYNLSLQAHRQQQETAAVPPRRKLQLAALVGAAGLALLPFNGAALAKFANLAEAGGNLSEGGQARVLPQPVFDLGSHGPAFRDLKVYWTTGSEGPTSSDVKNQTGISYYKYGKAEWFSPWTWKLTINTDSSYDYYFKDQSDGTPYELNVYQNAGTHSVEFSSDKPTIIAISGS